MQTDLRRRLATLLIPALVGVVAIGAVWTYTLGQRAAALAFDQALMATAEDVARSVRVTQGQAWFDLSRQSEAILRTDARDQIFFAVYLAGGTFVGGDADLAPGPVVRLGNGDSSDRSFRGRQVRALTMQFDQDGVPFNVTVAETTRKRREMALSLLQSMAIPAALLLCAAALVAWMSLRSALQPLNTLELALAARSERDLSPIDRSRTPKEVRSLIDTLNHLLARLQELTRAQQEFVADTAHQLRTPLASIQTDVELLPALAPEQQSQAIRRLQGSVSRAVRLAHQLLSLAKSERDSASIELRPLDLPALVESAADDWVHRAIATGVDLGFELSAARVEGDAFLLRELLENIVSNALRHAGRGGSVTVSTCAAQGHVLVQVDDSGPGIPPSERGRVFQRFHRVAGQAEDGGSGLGLAIVRQIALRHSGDVQISQSALGGASVAVRLPARAAG